MATRRLSVLKRVTEFNDRLTTGKILLDSHASIVSLLQSIENSTAQTVKFRTIDITRTNKSLLSVTGLLTTQNFDGALFQRSSYVAADIINNPLFTEVKLSQIKASDSKNSGTEKVVELKVSFNFAVTDVLYKPEIENTTVVPRNEATSEESVSFMKTTNVADEALAATSNETTL